MTLIYRVGPDPHDDDSLTSRPGGAGQLGETVMLETKRFTLLTQR